jgi:hypothetical protein
MARRRKKIDDSETLRLRKAVDRAVADDNRSKVLLLQQKVMADTRIIGWQNDKIKELCDLVDETRAKLEAALLEIEEYRFAIKTVRRVTQDIDLTTDQRARKIEAYNIAQTTGVQREGG